MLPTPSANLGDNGGPQHPDKRRAGGHSVTIEDAIHGLAMLPTPVASAFNDSEDVDAWMARRERVKLTANNGNGFGMPLGIAVAQLLPTPKAGDAQFDLPRTSGRPPEKSTHLATRLHYTDFGQYAAAVARQEAAFGYPAPPPTEPGKNRPRLSARFAEWMMACPPGWITDTPGVTRNEALRMAGNGVVAPQAAAALADMLPHAIAALTERTSA